MSKTDKPHAACGARTRGGPPCKTPSMANGRCRMHGGTVGANHGAPLGNQNATGGPDGNKKAVTTGEFEAIWLDQLEPIERGLVDKVSTDKLEQLNEQVRLTGIRIRRMLERIAQLKAMPEGERDDGLSLVETVDESGEKAVSKVKRKGRLGQIQAIEDALTRVQGHMAKLIDSKHRMEMDGSGTSGDDDDFNGSLFEGDGDAVEDGTGD